MSAKAFNEIRKRTGGHLRWAETSCLVNAPIDSGKQKHANNGSSNFLGLYIQGPGLNCFNWLFSSQQQVIVQHLHIHQYVLPLSQISALAGSCRLGSADHSDSWHLQQTCFQAALVLQVLQMPQTCGLKMEHIATKAEVWFLPLTFIAQSESSLSPKQAKQQLLFTQDCALCSVNPVSEPFLLCSLMRTIGEGPEIHSVQDRDKLIGCGKSWTIQKEFASVRTVYVDEFLIELNQTTKGGLLDGHKCWFHFSKSSRTKKEKRVRCWIRSMLQISESVSVKLSGGSLWPPGGGETIPISTWMAPYRHRVT